MSALDKIFNTKSLRSPGGQGYRTIKSLPKGMLEKIIARANAEGFGHRVAHGKIHLYSSDKD